ncbi:hypothetical protein [Rhodobacteraceae bacterium DSL-40]|uniref:hypothetical protein n=1 Tax=Amaricoccus sp. B4 TaxID=3368557 RepID=UPI000DADA0EB
MRIRRMTLVLPFRLRHMAEHEARRIAGEAAAELVKGGAATGHVRVDVQGRGLSGPALSGAVARSLAGRSRRGL